MQLKGAASGKSPFNTGLKEILVMNLRGERTLLPLSSIFQQTEKYLFQNLRLG